MFLFLLIGVVHAESDNKYGTWALTPDVVFCQNSNLKIQDIENAMDYWQSKGHNFNKIKIDYNCDNSPEHYTIKFAPPTKVNQQTSYGLTSLQVQAGYINHAVVEITDEGTDYQEVLIHEIGHALGYKHVSDKHDIMYDYHVDYHTNF